jgi:hypothetical protein
MFQGIYFPGASKGKKKKGIIRKKGESKMRRMNGD